MAKATPASPGSQERLLGSVLSIAPLAGNAEGDIVDAVGQLLDESLERATISRVQI